MARSQIVVGRRPGEARSAPRRASLTNGAWLALAVVYIVWGSTYLGIDLAVRTMPPFLMAALRFLIAGSLLYVWATRRGDRSDRPTARHWVSAFLIAAPMLAVGNAAVGWAEQTLDTGTASLIIASVPLWVVLIRLGLHERQSSGVLAGVGAGFAGVAVLLQPEGGTTALGIGLCVLSAVMWAVGSVASARLPMPADPFAATAWTMLAGGFVMLPFGLPTLASTSPSVASALGWVYLVTIGSVVGFTAYTWLLARAPLTLVSTYAYVNPVVAILLGVLFRNESVSVRMLVGATIVVSSVALVVRKEPPAATQPEEGVR